MRSEVERVQLGPLRCHYKTPMDQDTCFHAVLQSKEMWTSLRSHTNPHEAEVVVVDVLAGLQIVNGP